MLIPTTHRTKYKDMKCFLNLTMNGTANKSKMLLRAELKGCASDYCVSTPEQTHGAPGPWGSAGGTAAFARAQLSMGSQ